MRKKTGQNYRANAARAWTSGGIFGGPVDYACHTFVGKMTGL